MPAGALLATGVDDSEFVRSSGKNNGKLAKSDFSKTLRKAKESSFLIADAI